MLIGCGALNWDIFYEVKEIEAFSWEGISLKPGEETALERTSFLELLKNLKNKGKILFEGGGGSAANTIYALSSWGFRCAFLGSCGKDSFGDKVLGELKKAEVDTTFIKREGETSLALILLDKKKDRAIIVSPGSAEKALTFKKKNSYPQGFYHLSSLVSLEGKLFQRDLLLNLKSKISLDPGEIYAQEGRLFLKPFLEKTIYLFITERELEKSGWTREEILEKGVKEVYLKRGKEGAMVLKKNWVIKSSVYPAERIVDNTGAGDYFNAGILAGIFLGLPVEKTLEIGLYSASMSLRDYGRRGILNRKEFKKFVDRLK